MLLSVTLLKASQDKSIIFLYRKIFFLYCGFFYDI